MTWVALTFVNFVFAVFAGEAIRASTLKIVDQVNANLILRAYLVLAVIDVLFTMVTIVPCRTFTKIFSNLLRGSLALAFIQAGIGSTWIVVLAASGAHEFGGTLTGVPVDPIRAVSPIDAGLTQTFVDVLFAVVTFKAR